MTKVDLQAKADALIDEINFLRALYEAVSIFPHCFIDSKEICKGWKILGLGTSVNVMGKEDLTISCSAGTGSGSNPRVRYFCRPFHGQQPHPGPGQHHC